MAKLLLCILVLYSGCVQSENRCNKPPRPPPTGCCPDQYLHACCLGTRPCNASRIRPMPTSSPPKRPPKRQLVTNSTKMFPYAPIHAALNVIRFECSPPWMTPACGAGFYKLGNGTVVACPPGYYCPELYTCILPCAKGAYCVQFEAIMEKGKQKPGAALCKNMGMCCKDNMGKLHPPNEIKLSNGSSSYICPGMPSPEACPKGNYCPNTITKRKCTEGHFCPAGTVEPNPCPLMTTCNKGESAPLKNAAGPLLAALLIALIVLAYQLYVHFSDVKFFCKLHCGDIAGRERTFSRAFNVTDGIKGFTLNMREISGRTDGQTEITPKDFTIDLSFKDLSLTLKSRDKKMVLSGVTGCINSGEVTAVMGPSGAGKTTFLNALSGKAYYGELGGTIMVNGEPLDSIGKFRKVTGFVPQEDTMHRKLKVREVLMYQGKLRLPASTSFQEIKQKVDHILDLLEISHVADVPIGDEETRGISGGQRKRVNIGMELIADPTLLFLDEPTSGLDSTSSLSVLRALRAVAEKGKLTVICVIHQPRYEIFCMFHKLLFLGPGGRTVYLGDVSGSKKYFDDMGHRCPENINPADHYMDVIGGVTHQGEGDFDPRVLFEAWSEHTEEHAGQNDLKVKTKRLNSNVSEEREEADGFVEASGMFSDRVMPNLFWQFLVFLRREGVLQFRYIKSLLLDLFLVLLAGGVLGGLYAEVSLRKTIAMNTMSSLAIGLTAILSSLRCFGNHRTTFWRESASGVNRFSYFLAVNVCQLPIILITPLVYLSLQYTFTSPRALFKFHYLAVLFAQFATTGIGYAISCIFNPRNSQMAAVVIVLISSLLSGSMPDLCELNKYKVIGPVAYSLSYCRWFVEALFEKEAARYPAILQPLVDAIAFKNNYDLNSYWMCLLALFLFGVVFRVIAFLCLIFTNRGQQK